MFTPELIQAFSEFGLGAFALWLFYHLISKQSERHREDRKADTDRWVEASEKTDRVMEKFTDVISDLKEVTHKNQNTYPHESKDTHSEHAKDN